jgi:hypothetical protein
MDFPERTTQRTLFKMNNVLGLHTKYIHILHQYYKIIYTVTSFRRSFPWNTSVCLRATTPRLGPKRHESGQSLYLGKFHMTSKAVLSLTPWVRCGVIYLIGHINVRLYIVMVVVVTRHRRMVQSWRHHLRRECRAMQRLIGRVDPTSVLMHHTRGGGHNSLTLRSGQGFLRSKPRLHRVSIYCRSDNICIQHPYLGLL